jgi:hypothetical protein
MTMTEPHLSPNLANISLADGLWMLKNIIVRALKHNLLAAFFLQIIAIFIGVSFFYWPQSQPVFLFFSQLKIEYGSSYAVVATALFGGLLPYLYLLFSGKLGSQPIKQCLFYCLLWGAMGALVDAFYGLQSSLFGDDMSLMTIVKKTAFDQFVFSALLTCPLLTTLYIWKDNGFSGRITWQQLTPSMLFLKISATVVTNWLIWIPSVSLIYMMPSSLQIPLFNLVLCFFVLVLAALQNDTPR